MKIHDMDYEEALKWILENYFDGTIEDYRAFVDGDEECKVMATAVEALEKQTPKKIEKEIPKKTVTRIKEYSTGTKYALEICPECKKAVSGKPNYCGNCGQALEWGK